jgi:hypothetical protein
LGTALFSSRTFAQSPLNWSNAQHLDSGIQSSIAVLPSGLVIEVHRSENSNGKMWYHIGKVGQNWQNEYSISWGKSVPVEWVGDRPSIAVTKEGYVVLAYTRYDRPGNSIRYYAGTIDPNGNQDQTIAWRLKDTLFDTGQFAKLAFNSNDVLVEVHESGNNNGLFYRIGHLSNPAQGDFKLVWDSSNGNDGVKYDNGANPSVSVNDHNQLIESHQQRAGMGYVEYRRGTLSQSSISFASSGIIYDKDSNHPDVALTNNGVIVEAAATMGATFVKSITVSRTGILNGDPTFVNWSNSVQLGWSGWPGAEPSVATNGVVAVAIWTGADKLFYSIAPVQ